MGSLGSPSAPLIYKLPSSFFLLLVRCLLAVISTAPGLLTEPEENMSIVAGLESDNIASVNRKEGKWGMLKEVADLHKSGER